MKAHFRRCLMCFHTIRNKLPKDYFNCKKCHNFVHNNDNNECWFADRGILHVYFSDFVIELVTVMSKDNIRKAQLLQQQLICIESNKSMAIGMQKLLEFFN